MSEKGTSKRENDRRREPRKNVLDQYYSVEFPVEPLCAIYQFKIRDISARGMCILVNENSEVLEHLKLGDVLKMKYYPNKPSDPPKWLKTEIRYISKDPQGRFKNHLLIGLAVRN